MAQKHTHHRGDLDDIEKLAVGFCKLQRSYRGGNISGPGKLPVQHSSQRFLPPLKAWLYNKTHPTKSNSSPEGTHQKQQLMNKAGRVVVGDRNRKKEDRKMEQEDRH